MTDTVVDKLLLQAIASNKEKIKGYEVHRIQLQTQIDILTKENAEYLAEYQKTCPHTESVREQTHHMEGGYDYVSETQYRDVCTRCGKVTGSKLVRGTYA
jgi:hypothetical protein